MRNEKKFYDEDGGRSRPEDPSICTEWKQLQPKHTIFLSHSGAQKDFVEQLCVDLEKEQRFPFFDKRPDSLPKGEKFPQLIFQAAKQCRVAVLVLSHEFFTRSKWPMLELEAFVDAQTSGLNPDLKLFPLFFKISSRELNDLNQWEPIWEEWANQDRKRIDLEKWKKAVKALGPWNGIEFSSGIGEVSYRKIAVDAICRLVSADIRADVSFVKGKDRLCQAMDTMFASVPYKRAGLASSAKLLAVYGMGGTGKTTLCKILCNHFLNEFRGRACHITLGIGISILDLQKKVLRELTGASKDLLKFVVTSDEGQDLLQKRMYSQKVFLALDNVSENEKSLQEARSFLRVGFRIGSMVLVTARSLPVLLELLGNASQTNCVALPDLLEEEATDILLQRALPDLEGLSLTVDQQEIIQHCTSSCKFKRDIATANTYIGVPGYEINEYQYHPLALNAIGAQLGSNPNSWKERAARLNFKRSRDNEHPIFSVLESSFQTLPSERHRQIFLDIALYVPFNLDTIQEICQWLTLMYEETPDGIMEMLEDLKFKTLLDEWDRAIPTRWTRMHDLYSEFAEREANKKPFSKRWCFYEYGAVQIPAELRSEPPGSCWPIQRIGLPFGKFKNLVKAKLDKCANVTALGLEANQFLTEVDLRGLKNLRSLDMGHCDSLQVVQGLSSLQDLAWLRLSQKSNCGETVTSDEIDIIREDIYYEPGRIDCLTGLMSLVAGFCGNWIVTRHFKEPLEVGLADLRWCTALKVLEISGTRISHPPNLSLCVQLEVLIMSWNQWLMTFPKLEKLTSLQKIDFSYCSEVKSLPEVSQLNNLTLLSLYYCKSLQRVPDLGRLLGLKELNISHTQIAELKGIGSLEHLQKLECFQCCQLNHIPDLNKLTNLFLLELEWCKSLHCLPDLSNCSMLKEICIGHTALASLPSSFEQLSCLQKLDIDGCDNLPMKDILTLLELEKHPVIQRAALSALTYQHFNSKNDLKAFLLSSSASKIFCRISEFLGDENLKYQTAKLLLLIFWDDDREIPCQSHPQMVPNLLKMIKQVIAVIQSCVDHWQLDEYGYVLFRLVAGLAATAPEYHNVFRDSNIVAFISEYSKMSMEYMADCDLGNFGDGFYKARSPVIALAASAYYLSSDSQLARQLKESNVVKVLEEILVPLNSSQAIPELLRSSTRVVQAKYYLNAAIGQISVNCSEMHDLAVKSEINIYLGTGSSNGAV
eukprot:Gb_01384 [translate_table: standard]